MISLAHGTLLELPPPDLIAVAAASGFDAVGVRLTPWLPSETAYTVLGNEPMLVATNAALKRFGTTVLDIEVVRIEPSTRAAQFRGFFDAGARLGARYVLAVATDSDEARVAQTYYELCAEAAPCGLRVVLEFLPRLGIKTLAAAFRVVAAAAHPDGGILVDTVHFYRSGSTLAELAALPRALFPYIQICDTLQAEAPKMMPGEGELDLVDLLRAFPPDVPVSVEVPGGPDRSPDAAAYAARAFETARSVLAQTFPAA